jgi:hypothetical protein
MTNAEREFVPGGRAANRESTRADRREFKVLYSQIATCSRKGKHDRVLSFKISADGILYLETDVKKMNGCNRKLRKFALKV